MSKGIAGMGILYMIYTYKSCLQVLHAFIQIIVFIRYHSAHVVKVVTEIAKLWHDLSRVTYTRVLCGTAKHLMCCQACMTNKHWLMSAQDAAAVREAEQAKQQAQSKQARVRKVLADQRSQAQQAKNALLEVRKKEAAELKDSIRQFEQEEMQKWQQHKQQQAKTKQMYSQQVIHPL